MKNQFSAIVKTVLDLTSIGKKNIDEIQKTIDKYPVKIKVEMDNSSLEEAEELGLSWVDILKQAMSELEGIDTLLTRIGKSNNSLSNIWNHMLGNMENSDAVTTLINGFNSLLAVINKITELNPTAELGALNELASNKTGLGKLTAPLFIRLHHNSHCRWNTTKMRSGKLSFIFTNAMQLT